MRHLLLLCFCLYASASWALAQPGPDQDVAEARRQCNLLKHRFQAVRGFPSTEPAKTQRESDFQELLKLHAEARKVHLREGVMLQDSPGGSSGNPAALIIHELAVVGDCGGGWWLASMHVRFRERGVRCTARRLLHTPDKGGPCTSGVARGLHQDVDMTTFPPRRSRMSLLLTLLLLAPGVGLAAEETPPPADAPTEQATPSTDSPLPGTGARPKLRLTDVPAPEAERPSQPLRVLAEIGAGVLTGAGGLYLGYMGVFAVYNTDLGSSSYGLLAPVLLGVGTGLALGTWWGGELAGGDAKLGSTFLGMLVGGGAGVLMTIPMENPFMSLLLCPPLMLIGSIIGYENSERGATLKSVQPLLSVSSRGATLGLAGTF